MGMFSWLDCKDKTQIRINDRRPAYVLVPERYQSFYGDHGAKHHIEETCYNGDGMFGGHDIYELVAAWNEDFINGETGFKKYVPEPSQDLMHYQGLYEFEKKEMAANGKTDKEIQLADYNIRKDYCDRAMANYRYSMERFSDNHYLKLDRDEMEEKYGDDYLREIGIELAGEDENNLKLPFPIKITHDPDLTYEDAEPSLTDDAQGGAKSYSETLVVPADKAAEIHRWCEIEPACEEEAHKDGENISMSVKFMNGMEAVIYCCGVEYEEGGCNTAYACAELYDAEGNSVSYCEARDDFFTEWEMEYDGDTYTVSVEEERSIDELNNESWIKEDNGEER